MKKIVSILLAFCMLAALGVPALAETESSDDMETRLQEITIRVKNILEIDDEYAEFSGSYSDGLRPGWDLYWSDDGRSMNVSCDEAGVITYIYRWENSGMGSSFYGFDAAFPALAEDDAREQAEYWLDRMMGEGETARIDRTNVPLTRHAGYSFSGTVLLNGLESPITFYITIGEIGLQSYSRSDGSSGYVYLAPGMSGYAGMTVPSPKPSVDEADAADALADAVAMDLYYVTDADGEVRLRYVPVGPYTVVDAQSGEAVDMDALYASFGGSASRYELEATMEAAMAMDNGMGRGLTEVELSSIANYRDALPQEELDAMTRAIACIGLEGFEFVRCSYRMDGDGNITANLRYTCEMTEDNLFGYSRSDYRRTLEWGDPLIVTKYITVDAKSGGLQSLSTSYPLWDRDGGMSGEIAEETAEAFLQACAPDKFAQTAMREGSGAGGRDSQTYARLHDGYFFPENYLQVSVNSAVGTVDDYYFVWDDEAVFAPSEDIVSLAEAKDAYIGALEVTLGYAAWPEAINYDDPILYRYADWGYTFVESLRLGYYYSGTAEVAGVDALTGEPITASPDGIFVYSDLEGVPERTAIETLGEAGIGFDGGSFHPAEALTMADAARLLLQADSYYVRDWDEEALKDEAVWRGFFSAADWEADRELTRMDMLRAILGASEYGSTAALEGVWDTGFKDVDAADEGFAAIARALGMASGKKLEPDKICTRADGAQLLYDFMNR